MKRRYLPLTCALASFLVVLLASLASLEVYALLLVAAVATTYYLVKLFSVDLSRVTAAMTAVVAYSGVTALYACAYFLLGRDHISPAFSGGWRGVLDAFYFSFVTITTLGFGDYEPTSTLAKAMVMSQLVAGVLVVAFGINYVAAQYRRGNGE